MIPYNNQLRHLSRVEPLPRRALLSGTVTLDPDGTLRVVGTSGADAIVVDVIEGRVEVSINGAEKQFDPSQAIFAFVDAGAGDDTVRVGGITARVDAGRGDDRVRGERATLNGGTGNDLIDAGDGSLVDYSTRSSGIVYRETPQIGFEAYEQLVHIGVNETDTLDTVANDTIRGTAYDDQFLRGADFDNVPRLTLHGSGGDDTFHPGATVTDAFGDKGNDTFTAPDDTGRMSTFAPMTVYGGGGDDLLIPRRPLNFDEVNIFLERDFGPGTDVIDLGSFTNIGDDYIFSLGLNEFVEQIKNLGATGPADFTDFDDFGLRIEAEGTFPVTVRAGSGNDTIRGSDQGDEIFAGEAFDRIEGRGGNDTIRGGANKDVLLGNSGNDQLFGEGGNDNLFGGSGNDRITGGGGRDLLDGQAGDDTFFARDTLRDTIFGGSGFDRAQRDNSSRARDLIDGIEQTIT